MSRIKIRHFSEWLRFVDSRDTAEQKSVRQKGIKHKEGTTQKVEHSLPVTIIWFMKFLMLEKK